MMLKKSFKKHLCEKIILGKNDMYCNAYGSFECILTQTNFFTLAISCKALGNLLNSFYLYTLPTWNLNY
jgi:hypothetical protein